MGTMNLEPKDRKVKAGTKRAWIALGGTALVAAMVVTYALPLLRHNAAEANCVAAVPGPEGEQGGNGSTIVQWRLLPMPHWECSYSTEPGVTGKVDLGWWG